VERWETVSLEPGLVNGGVIVEENKVAEKIKEVFINIKRSKGGSLLSGKGKLIVGLSGRDSLYRVLSLPILSDALLAEAVRREAGRVLPVSLNELYLAYQRIPGMATETRVFVAAFPKKATDILLRTLKLAGLAPKVLDLAPLALCIAIDEPRSIIADVRMDSLNIIVMADRVPQVIRSLSLPSEDKAIAENMPTIVEEFSRTVAFYNSSHQQDPLNADIPVFVSGELAAEPSTWQPLVGKLNSKVAILPSALQYPSDFPVNDFIVNLGLAAKELGLQKEAANYSLVNLNVLPASALPQPIDPFRIIVPVVAVAGIAGCFLMWQNWQTTQNDITSLQKQVTDSNNQITINNKAIATLTEQNRVTQSQIQPILDSGSVFVTKLQGISTARALTDADVHSIVAKKPDTVNLTGVSDTTSSRTVTGTSASEQEVLKYAQTLRDTGGYKTVMATITYNPNITTDGVLVKEYDFSLTLN
jgi:type IV pilus assembly protein PilM